MSACVSTGESVTPSNIYDACMPIEIKEANNKKKQDAKAYAHYICTYYARTCKEKPEGSICLKAMDRYSGTSSELAQ